MIHSNFYMFLALTNLQKLHDHLSAFGQAHDLKGTILLAEEGINVSVSGTRDVLDRLYACLTDVLGLDDTINAKEMAVQTHTFKRFKVRLKKEIIKIDCPHLDLALSGRLVDSDVWDQLIEDPDYFVIDTRNTYEVEEGTFLHAHNPKIDNFQDLKDWMESHRELWEKRKIAMFCTGGIRCEKSTALARQLGAQDVVHLKGGILQYLIDKAGKESLWQGKCFVFDDRGTVEAKDFIP